MTEHKHTPGPWVARTRANPSRNGSFRVYATVNECHIKGTVRPGDFFIANVISRSDCFLMAAAPELLGALVVALAASGQNASWSDDARAAIAKAKGETK